MFVTGPPDLTGGGGLRIGRTDRRIFGGSSELATDPSMRPYLADMVAPYGLALREDVFDAAAGHSYGEMAEPLIEAVTTADDPVDLLVIAYAVHDIRLGQSTATYLSGRCPGDPLAFAVCDQGVAGPFTALRAAQAYAATGACRRALLLVVEQSALHYELARPARLPDRHAAVAFLLECPATTDPITVRQHTVASPEQAADALTKDAEIAGRQNSDTTLVIGPDLAAGRSHDHLGADEVIVAPQGQPCTGVWWELSARLRDWQSAGRRVVLAEYDPVVGRLCTAVVRFDRSLALAGHDVAPSSGGPTRVTTGREV